VIDNEVMLIAEKNLLRNIHTGEEITLKQAAALCLQLLLSRHNTIVTQLELMAFAWGVKHREVSFNTFYQCILAVRRSLQLLGINKQVITTIPRKGLIIYDNIPVQCSQDKLTAKSLLTDPLPKPEPLFPVPLVGSDSPVMPAQETLRPSVSRNLRLFVYSHKRDLLSVVITLLASLIFLSVWHQPARYFAGYQYGGELKNTCRFFFNADSHSHDRHMKFLENFPEHCPPHNYAYITAHEDTKNISVFICAFPADATRRNTCRSVYYPEYPDI